MDENINNEVNLYELQDGKLILRTGIISSPDQVYRCATFISDQVKITCSDEPGVVYNSVVWFKNLNDELAKNLLISYHESSILVLEGRIMKHEQKINAIKDNIEKVRSTMKGGNKNG